MAPSVMKILLHCIIVLGDVALFLTLKFNLGSVSNIFFTFHNRFYFEFQRRAIYIYSQATFLEGCNVRLKSHLDPVTFGRLVFTLNSRGQFVPACSSPP